MGRPSALSKPFPARGSRLCPRRPRLEPLEDRCLLATSPFTYPLGDGDPRVDPSDFRVTVFATGLHFPAGMQQLADGSLLVATGTDSSWSAGQLLRLVDADGDGQADGPGTVLYSGLPGVPTAVSHAGDLFFVTSSQRDNEHITVLRAGATPDAPLTPLGGISFFFPPTPTWAWEHRTYGNAARLTPGGAPGQYDLFFNVGSQYNGVDDQGMPEPSTLQVSISGLATGTEQAYGDSIYMVRVADTGPSAVTFSGLTQIARGIRNAAGMVFDPATGDLYFADNGIDGHLPPEYGNEPESADELNRIAAADLGGAVENFGYPYQYIQYRTGVHVGGDGGVVQPLVAYQPLYDPKAVYDPDGFYESESEGAAGIALAPAGFPAGLAGGVFVGFDGKGSTGTANEENPLVFADLAHLAGPGPYFNFISNEEPDVGHLDFVLSTADSLFIADLYPNGTIYQVRAMASIHGRAFNDLNGDGVSTAGEPGLPGRTVFLDTNSNGVFDPGEPSTTTDANGNYQFTQLEPGTYRVRQVGEAGWVLTTTPAPIVAVSNTHATGVDLGNFRLVSLSGRVFNDKNGDGVRGAKENGLSGVTVFLDTNGNGVLDATEVRTLTDAQGFYTFSNLGPGTYRVREGVPSGWVQTTPARDVTVSSGQDVTGQDIGIKKSGKPRGSTHAAKALFASLAEYAGDWLRQLAKTS